MVSGDRGVCFGIVGLRMLVLAINLIKEKSKEMCFMCDVWVDE